MQYGRLRTMYSINHFVSFGNSVWQKVLWVSNEICIFLFFSASQCQRCTNVKNNGECNKQKTEICSADQVAHSLTQLSKIYTKMLFVAYLIAKTVAVLPWFFFGKYIVHVDLVCNNNWVAKYDTFSPQSCETKVDRRTKALTKKCTPTSSCISLCHGNSAICTFCCQGDNCNEGNFMYDESY